jgi:hypothetical protein
MMKGANQGRPSLERSPIMPLSLQEQQLRDQFFQTLSAAVLPLPSGSDPEVTLEAMIEAVQMLQERLQRELAELRQEQAD